MRPVRVGLIGAGRIGASHAAILARRVATVELAGVADAVPAAASRLAAQLGVKAFGSPAELIGSDEVEAVVIAASSTAHCELIVAAAGAGKAIFCEKPMSMTLEEADRALAAAADVPLQVGFNRRFDAGFAAARHVVATGGVGTPQLLRSLTRDPGLANPGAVPPWTIFTQTLIHDFDTLLWFNPDAEVVEVYATADALVAPEYKSAGLLDTAVTVLTFDNGARAVAEASFSATYGYDVRAEVFGSAGMVTVGDQAASSLTHFGPDGRRVNTVRGDVELFLDAYTAEFAEFANAVRAGREPAVTGRDARRALAVALACVESVTTNRPVTL
ncbi:Gfo/Idh/MocA family oxidoreductase [Cryptosporangium aurantiacum]|uniref:Gfo/Idh/MocA family oxidoreductase n=1 Tax=Cryptosporangium aurantiacum TaxID=134849 RepID=UPI000932B378